MAHVPYRTYLCTSKRRRRSRLRKIVLETAENNVPIQSRELFEFSQRWSGWQRTHRSTCPCYLFGRIIFVINFVWKCKIFNPLSLENGACSHTSILSLNYDCRYQKITEFGSCQSKFCEAFSCQFPRNTLHLEVIHAVAKQYLAVDEMVPNSILACK